ncbi:hypothetical protein MES4922_10258 [Mesorhizobium ventifaucium]|uniref:Uncharacterized protein n=1 Tax=Mesorhizobium ventifaucium TaxID=666020 RepID=A0ABM9DF29_9HYPH|nr:hypothetical protein MES4922_10258 [Mesorhizobium ventifaucium]
MPRVPAQGRGYRPNRWRLRSRGYRPIRQRKASPGAEQLFRVCAARSCALVDLTLGRPTAADTHNIRSQRGGPFRHSRWVDPEADSVIKSAPQMLPVFQLSVASLPGAGDLEGVALGA